MVDHLDQTERVDRELNVVKRARFNQTIKVDKSNEVPESKFGVEPHTVKELPALPVRERQQDNMLLHQQLQDNMLDEEVVSFGQRAQHQQDQQQLQLRQHNIPHNPVSPETEFNRRHIPLFSRNAFLDLSHDKKNSKCLNFALMLKVPHEWTPQQGMTRFEDMSTTLGGPQNFVSTHIKMAAVNCDLLSHQFKFSVNDIFSSQKEISELWMKRISKTFYG